MSDDTRNHENAVRPRSVQGILGVGDGEGRTITGQKPIITPSKEEVENHMRTHVPMRAWCEFCVMGKGKNSQHRSGEKMKREVPMISYDYMMPKSDKEKRGEEDPEQKSLQSLWVSIMTRIGSVQTWCKRKDRTLLQSCVCSKI